MTAFGEEQLRVAEPPKKNMEKKTRGLRKSSGGWLAEIWNNDLLIAGFNPMQEYACQIIREKG